MAVYGTKAGGQEEGAMVMKLSASSDKRQAWACSYFLFVDFELNLKPVREEKEEETGMIEGGGNAGTESNGEENEREFESLSRRDGLNGV